jgi:hypothetical protein
MSRNFAFGLAHIFFSMSVFAIAVLLLIFQLGGVVDFPPGIRVVVHSTPDAVLSIGIILLITLVTFGYHMNQGMRLIEGKNH